MPTKGLVESNRLPRSARPPKRRIKAAPKTGIPVITEGCGVLRLKFRTAYKMRQRPRPGRYFSNRKNRNEKHFFCLAASPRKPRPIPVRTAQLMSSDLPDSNICDRGNILLNTGASRFKKY